jgi:intracellular multiplication protein IcmB
MASVVESILESMDSFLAWLSSSLKQTTESYCELETADSPTVLVTHDGSLVTLVKIGGTKTLIGGGEFERICEELTTSLRTTMSRQGHGLQVLFSYDRARITNHIREVLAPARETAQRINLQLVDLFKEKENYLGSYCAEESVFFAFWTRPNVLSAEQLKAAVKEKQKRIKTLKLPAFRLTQNIIASYPEIRNAHDAFVRSIVNDLNSLDISAEILEVHEACREIRLSADPEFTDKSWQPVLPGDPITPQDLKRSRGDIADLLWPSLAKQVLPRDGENLDLRTARIGDKIYSGIFIDLFPKEIKSFSHLFQRVLSTQIPWRISFWIESSGLGSLRLKSTLAAILSFASPQNRLISDASNLLDYISLNTDDAVVRLRVAACTWAYEGELNTLRIRTSELAKAIEGWGSCDVSEVCGDAFEGITSSMLAMTSKNVATASIAQLSDVVRMLPTTRPASPWSSGALLFRSPDGKLWPFQPGSSQQTTWIDLLYARPGSGKSVLSNAINLALCLSAGIRNLPRIAIIDVGPSSSGLISLLKEALPQGQRHQVAYHRLRMTPDYAVNPFDTQLGCRFPTPLERAFLVNFMTLLATPVGSLKPYDGIADLAGLVVDEVYKNLSDAGNPYAYNSGVEPLIDGILAEIGFIQDAHTTWWEVTDALFLAGFPHEAGQAQRYAMPLLADAASICRTPAIEDLYGKIIAPTGETLINSFGRMISAAVREYPILSRVTVFDLGEARIVSLDLDEVAKTGGDAADRQTAVMYMLARYILARHYYLTEENVGDIPDMYKNYHKIRIKEIRETPKRLVYDEFHRTAKSLAVREQVVIDMREGRKWNVQVALISQSLDDFDSVMMEFGTSIYIMDAGPLSAIERTAKIFGLSDTAKLVLRTRVHGPREGGSTFLAQFSTNNGLNTQLLTCTLGPIELWAFSTTAEDAQIRNQLYRRIGPVETRRVLATLFPSGSAKKYIERRLNILREESGLIIEASNLSIADQIIEEILQAYTKDPNFKKLPL